MFQINQRSGQPLYEQLLANIEEAIMNQVFLKDEQLPSVRALAQDLAINPNTIQKTYGILEERGIIYSRPGRGSFVAVSAEELGAKRTPNMYKQLDHCLESLFQLRIQEEDIVAHIHEFFTKKWERGEAR